MAVTYPFLLWGARQRDQLIGSYPRPTAQQRRAFIDDARRALPPDRLLYQDDQILAYSYDATGERHRPDLVGLPQSKHEVATLVQLAARHRLPIVSRGAGTNLSGGTVPVVGGLVISLSRMTRVLEIDVDNRRVRVQPGVVNADLQETLAGYGFFYAPDPSSHRISTLGGNIAENSGGPHCVKYGVTTNHVLGLEIVTAQGELVSLPETSAARQVFDLNGLITGSEGTLGLVVEATLAITPLMPARRTLLAIFQDLNDAVRTVSRIIAARVVPAALELMDRVSIDIIEQFVHAGYPAGADAVLLIELDGTDHSVEAEALTVKRIAQASGASEIREATSAAQAEALWRGRRAHYGATARLSSRIWVQDVTVPRPQLSTMMREVLAIAERHQITILTAAHAGDGNLHPAMPYNPDDADEVQRLRAADREILEACVRLGGAITGEHGVGIDKIEHLPLMYRYEELDIMYGLKQAWDPQLQLNPFKAVLAPAHARKPQEPLPAPQQHWTPATTREVQEMVIWARQANQRLRITGTGHRSSRSQTQTPALTLTALNRLVDLDQDNLTITVEAGMLARDLAQLLSEIGLELPGVERFGEDSIGGLVASNALFWRDSFGLGWRDWVLAVQWVDGQGRVLQFGRKTTKNVAGYDVTKLAVGSRGRLGAITQVTLRLKPSAGPWWCGQWEHDSLSEALTIALAMAKTPVRPDGLAIVRNAQSPTFQLLVYAANQRYQELQTHWPAMTWQPADAMYPQHEAARLEALYTAWQAGRYRVQAALPTQLGDRLQAIAASGQTIWVYPSLGLYELFDAEPAVEGVDEVVLRMAENVRQVFDPHQLFEG